jgi:hypothetical protein
MPWITPLLVIVTVSPGLKELGTSMAYAPVEVLPTKTPGFTVTDTSETPAT